MAPEDTEAGDLVPATLAQPDGMESLAVLWNPARYRVRREQDLGPPVALAGGGGEAWVARGGQEWFETELYLDTSDRQGAERDARGVVERLAAWMDPLPGGGPPREVVFAWGPFRFRGALYRLEEEWLGFDADGTPVRAWVTLVLRRLRAAEAW